MKNFIRILVWTFVALAIQQSIFFYVENKYLAADVKIKAEKVEEKEIPKPKVKNPNEIDIKDGLGDVSLSSNGRFVAYIEDNKLKVLDSNDKSEKEFQSENNGEVVFYKWFTNEDTMIVIQKIQKNREFYFEPVSFTAKKGEVRKLADVNSNEVKISIKNNTDKIDNVAFSNATHSLYIKVQKENGKSDLYYANVMNQLEKVRSNKDIGNVIVPTTNANAVLEMGTSATILNSPGDIEIPNVDITKVLGTDIKDNVYFGEEVNKKITKIHYTILNNQNNKWNTISLAKPVDKEDIIIDYFGKIYINDKLAGSVLEITSKKTIKYTGQLVQAYSKGFISRDGNKLLKNELETNNIHIN
jgi:hypothetical protein